MTIGSAAASITERYRSSLSLRLFSTSRRTSISAQIAAVVVELPHEVVEEAGQLADLVFEATVMRSLKSPVLACSKWSISCCSGSVIEPLILAVKARTSSRVRM